MGAKAVYASLTLAIYINGPELDALLESGSLIMETHLGKDWLIPAGCFVELADDVKDAYRKALADERKVYEDARRLFRAEHPDYVNSDLTHNRSNKRGRKRTHSPDVPNTSK